MGGLLWLYIAVAFIGGGNLILVWWGVRTAREIVDLRDQLVAARLSIAKMGDCYRLLADNVRTDTNRIINLEDEASDGASVPIACSWPEDKVWITGRLNEIEGMLTGFSQSWLEGKEPLEGEG